MVGNRIQVAFCFDKNMFAPACVSIASLIDSKEIEEHFDIYCIVDEEVEKSKKILEDIVGNRDVASSISCYRAPDTYEAGHVTRGISVATYLRFSLHKILEGVDKILYMDTDILVCKSLKELWETDINNYYFAGVKGTNNFKSKWDAYKELNYYDELDGLQGEYINAGILLMNLKRIRETVIEDIWLEKSQKQYMYQDQDIINITCKGQILFLPLKYNLAAYLVPHWYKEYYVQNIYSKEECMDAYAHPVVLHYAGDKPWHNRNRHRTDAWWDYVLSQKDIAPMFEKLRKNYFSRFVFKMKHLYRAYMK